MIKLIAIVDDSNIAGRGGVSALKDAKTKAQKILESDSLDILKYLKDFDDYMISKNLSPGGSADLLAIIIFIEEMSKYFERLFNRAENILVARENRANKIEQLAIERQKTILSFKINYPGINKNGVFQDILFEVGKEELIKAFKLQPHTYIIEDTEDGKSLIAVLDDNKRIIKCKTIEIETEHKLGRLFDIDIYDSEGSISRKDFGLPSRKCIICDDLANNCRRSNKHTEEMIIYQTEKKILEFLKDD